MVGKGDREGVGRGLSVRSLSSGGVEESASNFFHDGSDPVRREAVEETDVSDSLQFSVQVLRRADVVGSPCKGSDDAVLGGVGGAGVVLRVEVGMSRLPVDGGGLVRMDEHVKEGEESVRRGVFHGKVEVFSEGVEEGEVGFCVIFVSERSTAVVNKVGVGGRRIR